MADLNFITFDFQINPNKIFYTQQELIFFIFIGCATQSVLQKVSERSTG
jgi:hypothetical protein